MRELAFNDYFRKTNPWPGYRMPQLHSFVKRITN
jgi:hypothetical protein